MRNLIFLLLCLSCTGTSNMSSLKFSELAYGRGDSAIKGEIQKIEKTENGLELLMLIQDNGPSISGSRMIPENQNVTALLYGNNLRRIESKKEKEIESKLKKGAILLATLRMNERLGKYEIFDIEIQ